MARSEQVVSVVLHFQKAAFAQTAITDGAPLGGRFDMYSPHHPLDDIPLFRENAPHPAPGRRLERPEGQSDEGIVSIAGATNEVMAVVTRWEPGQPVQIVQTPPNTVVVRLFLGVCVLSVNVGSQWLSLGEYGLGGLHISHAGQVVRTEWQGLGEGLALYLPAHLWREKVAPARHARAELELGADATLLQLVKLLVNSTLEAADMAFVRHMVDTVLARVNLLFSQRTEHRLGATRTALPRWRTHKLACYIQEHLSDPVTLADMAAAAGLSPMHFAAQFRVATGLRPHQYLLQCRVQHAKTLLIDASRTLIDIALCVGFRTQAHFTTVFKNLEGATPMQWRRSRLQRAA
jgi:AraC family transcriptional regulator